MQLAYGASCTFQFTRNLVKGLPGTRREESLFFQTFPFKCINHCAPILLLNICQGDSCSRQGQQVGSYRRVLGRNLRKFVTGLGNKICRLNEVPSLEQLNDWV